jgi:hypothetical protein
MELYRVVFYGNEARCTVRVFLFRHLGQRTVARTGFGARPWLVSLCASLRGLSKSSTMYYIISSE